jgi:PAS domain S-box-containing protein
MTARMYRLHKQDISKTMDAGQFDFNQIRGTFDWNLISHEFISSQRLNRIFGFYPQSKIDYSDFIKTFHPEDKAIWDYAIKYSYPKETLKCEMRIITKDKSVRWIKLLGKINYDERRLPVRVHCTAQDITELKELFSELKESEQKFRILADSMPQQIWTTDAKGNLNYFNQAVFNFSGLNFEEMKKEGWTYLVHPEDHEESKKKWTEAIISGKEFVIQHRLRNFMGEYRWHQSRAIPQKDSQGTIQMWVGTMTDIQGQKNFVQELEKKIQQRTRSLIEENVTLTKTNNELQQFAYMASHDLQEPLRKIITFSNRIQQQYNDDMPEGSKAYIEKIIASSQRMTRLIEDLLNFSMVAGSDEQFVETDLNDVLKLVLTDFEELIRDKGAQIIHNDLPMICANTVQMSQLFHNLIGNALKFSKEGVPPIIEISSRAIEYESIMEYPELMDNNNYIELTFKDNGIGFDQQYANKIFAIFHRLNHDEKYKGTGIGLALCKKIVENHQGTIDVTSEVGKGASFKIILPV